MLLVFYGFSLLLMNIHKPRAASSFLICLNFREIFIKPIPKSMHVKISTNKFPSLSHIHAPLKSNSIQNCRALIAVAHHENHIRIAVHGRSYVDTQTHTPILPTTHLHCAQHFSNRGNEEHKIPNVCNLIKTNKSF